MRPPEYFPLEVAAVIQETHDSCSFEFTVPTEHVDRFKYRPGQFLTLRIPFVDDWLPRCYSLSSSPFEQENLRITVKRVDDGRGSNWLCDNIQPGAHLDVMPPSGVFVPKTFDGNFLLFAGGSGITPVLSILRSVLSQGTGKIRLIYANRDERSVIFRDFLQVLASEHPERLQIVHWLTSVQGIPSVHQLALLTGGFEEANSFICGPALFMDACVEALKKAGLDDRSVHVERFVSLPGESEQSHESVVEHKGASATQLTVELDGDTHEIDCEAGELLLAAMQRKGMQPPHSCLVGSCASCMCTLVSGEVDLIRNDALDQQELEEGWTLACQAVATSAHVHLRFPD